MAADNLPFETDEGVLSSSGAVTDFYSTGVQLQGRSTGVAIILEMSDPGGGFDAQCDAIVQTAHPGITNSDNDSWTDTNARINGIVDPGVYMLQLTDGILPKLRVRFENTGDLDADIRVRWLCDVAPSTLLT